MKNEELTIMRDPANPDFYLATYSADEGNEAQGLAYRGDLNGAIEEALNVWGLSEHDVDAVQLLLDK